MIQRQTWVYVTDNSLAQWVKVFHLYGGFKRRFTTINFYIKGSIRLVKPFIIYYKGFQVKKMQQGMIVRGLITRQVYTCLYKTSISYKTKLNTIVLIKKKIFFYRNTYLVQQHIRFGINVYYFYFNMFYNLI